MKLLPNFEHVEDNLDICKVFTEDGHYHESFVYLSAILVWDRKINLYSSWLLLLFSFFMGQNVNIYLFISAATLHIFLKVSNTSMNFLSWFQLCISFLVIKVSNVSIKFLKYSFGFYLFFRPFIHELDREVYYMRCFG